MAHLRLKRTTLLEHAKLFPFVATRRLLLAGYKLHAVTLQPHFAADVEAAAAAAAAPDAAAAAAETARATPSAAPAAAADAAQRLSDRAKARLCSKYGVHAGAFGALLAGAGAPMAGQRLGGLSAGALQLFLPLLSTLLACATVAKRVVYKTFPTNSGTRARYVGMTAGEDEENILHARRHVQRAGRSHWRRTKLGI